MLQGYGRSATLFMEQHIMNKTSRCPYCALGFHCKVRGKESIWARSYYVMSIHIHVINVNSYSCHSCHSCHFMVMHVHFCQFASLMSFNVINCNFMAFYGIHENSCYSCKFMSFMPIDVNSCYSCQFVSIYVNSCHVSLYFSGNSVKWVREGGSNMSS
jgi:hypothetical protein